MRKTAILTSVAGLFLLTAPAALAQDTAPQTPPSATPAPAEPATVSLQPGATVKGSDGSTLGVLEGARQGPSGQEITVRGSDGQLRGVPVAGLTRNGADIAVAWTSSQYQSAPAIGAATPATEAAPAPDAMAPATSAPATEPQPTDPASPPAGEEPETPADEPATTPDQPGA